MLFYDQLLIPSLKHWFVRLCSLTNDTGFVLSEEPVIQPSLIEWVPFSTLFSCSFSEVWERIIAGTR